MSKRDKARAKLRAIEGDSLPDFTVPRTRPRSNPYLTDAAGGGVGPGHGLHVTGEITSQDPVTGAIQAMSYELPPGVTPDSIGLGPLAKFGRTTA